MTKDKQTRRWFLKGSSAAVVGAALGSTGTRDGRNEWRVAAQDATVREFTVHAIPVDIVHDRFGLHQPEGAMYVLDENLDAALEASGVAPDEGFDLVDGNGDDVDTSVIQPLVIRAIRGEVVRIELVNHLDRHVSIHQTALPYDVDESDGAAVGFNEPSTVAPDDSGIFEWFAVHQGSHFFFDAAYQAWDSTPDGNPEEVNSMARGLYGALLVEPEGSQWRDPETGGELRSGVRSDVFDARLDTWYREFVAFYGDPGEVLTAEGEEPTWPDSDEEQGIHNINYRAVTTGQRLRERDDCVDCTDSNGFYSSWVHGDPGGGDNTYEAYLGDPVKLVAIGASLEENHSHHLHGHRWKEIPGEPGSDTIDAQTVSVGATFETYLTIGQGELSVRPDITFREAFEVGAGSEHESAGDYLFHCHLFPHYAEGMNALMRVHDKEQAHLVTLPNNEPPLPADSDVPGFPEFVPGEIGEIPPPPPPVRSATEDENLAFDDPIRGAPYTDPCEGDDVAAVRDYTIVAMPADIVYNDAGHHDPDGEVYVEAANEGAVRDGTMNPEPLVIRANVGDCINLTFRNQLDTAKSIHTHFVRFDVLGSDSLTMGFNYDQSVPPGEERQFRWYANEEGAIFFHDHITGIEESMHGSFAALIVEPPGSTWLDPHTGREIQSGTQAIIQDPDGEDFRELVAIYHDFAPLVDEDGEFVNPLRQHNQNAGVMAINYRNTPYYVRGADPDPAYVHSSAVHGDPATPVLETYAGDPVRIRHVMAPWEEQHNFGIHSLDLGRVGIEPSDQMAEIINVSEARTFAVREDPQFADRTNPAGLPIRDYLYGSFPSDDLWDGMWGLLRSFGAEVDHLQPLPDRESPDGSISTQELREMGHPAPFSDPQWTNRGHLAKLIYSQFDDPELPPDAAARQNENVGEIPPPPPDPGLQDVADQKEAQGLLREYDVTVVQVEIPYNDYGDHDPHGIAFVLDEHVDEVLAGERHPEPIVLRANEGELVRVTLTNALPDEFDDDHAHPQMRTPPFPWDASSRISLHPVNVTHDVLGSDGATVGFNYDQTVAPGESITYHWLADEQTDGCVLWDMADIRGHRHHAAFGQLVVEPPDSVWLDPQTGDPIETGAAAMIDPPGGEAFREFVISMSDGQFVVNDDGTCVVPGNPEDPEHDPDAPCNQIGDPEDQGYVGVNNRAEPFVRRFDEDDRQEVVFSSEIHGDPATPVFNAFVDDPVVLRLAQTADKQRGISFHVAAHQWLRHPHDEDRPVATPRIGVEHNLTPGKAHNLELLGGAGGVEPAAASREDRTGDYLYQGLKHRRRLEAGWWGILRVGDDESDFDEDVQPLP